MRPSCERSNAEICIQKIVEVLRETSGEYGINIVRMKVVGSFVKKTYTNGSDIDLAVFINNAYPPFNDILFKFQTILRSKLGIHGQCKKI